MPGLRPTPAEGRAGTAGDRADRRRAEASRGRPPRPHGLSPPLLPTLRRGTGRGVRTDSWELFCDLLLTRPFPEAIARVRHRALDTRPCSSPGRSTLSSRRSSRCSTRSSVPVLGAQRWPVHRRDVSNPADGRGQCDPHGGMGRTFGLTLAETVAYADATSDLPMLEAAGFPVAVNPGTKAGDDRPATRLADRELVGAKGGPWYPLALSMRSTGHRTLSRSSRRPRRRCADWRRRPVPARAERRCALPRSRSR